MRALGVEMLPLADDSNRYVGAILGRRRNGTLNRPGDTPEARPSPALSQGPAFGRTIEESKLPIAIQEAHHRAQLRQARPSRFGSREGPEGGPGRQLAQAGELGHLPGWLSVEPKKGKRCLIVHCCYCPFASMSHPLLMISLVRQHSLHQVRWSERRRSVPGAFLAMLPRLSRRAEA
jgi:hypothetical protein